MEYSSRPKHNNLNLSLDLRLICLVLLAVIVGMLLVWRPWDANAVATDRTVEVTGQATLKAEPDEYVFYPMYTFTNPAGDRQASIDAASAKSEELVKKLRELGVAPSKIRSSTSGYDNRYSIQPAPEPDPNPGNTTYNLTLTVTASGLKLAQKVQDYLVTTAPTGSVSPQAQFSTTMRKMLEDKARDEATRDARAKADQSAKNLGFAVVRVKSVNDGAGFGGVIPLGRMESGAAVDTKATAPSLGVQPGENDLTYSVTVVYYIR